MPAMPRAGRGPGVARVPEVPALTLVREARLADLLPSGGSDRHEASGVLATGDSFYVVFDNSRDVAVIGRSLTPDGGNHTVMTAPGAHEGFEDIARDPVTGHLYLLVEAAPRRRLFMARVEEYDEQWQYVSGGWLDFPLSGGNKGIEGLTCVRRDGVTFLLGLCEGNRCRSGAAGRRPGGGRIQVFRRGSRHWRHTATIRLPGTLWFEDYSGLSVADERIALVSQQSSALWVGRLTPSTWEVADEGTCCRFPRDARGRTVYCTVEGVSWLGDDQLVTVSDRVKIRTQDRRCQATHQSVHVFALPSPDRP
jgi:hypothetical protein